MVDGSRLASMEARGGARLVEQQLASNTTQDKPRELPTGFVPGNWDVICSKGAESFDHVGNRRFRILIVENLEKYANSLSKISKSIIVGTIVDSIRESARVASGGGFVRQDLKTGKWFELGDRQARDKVGQAIRAALRKRKHDEVSEGPDSKKSRSPATAHASHTIEACTSSVSESGAQVEKLTTSDGSSTIEANNSFVSEIFQAEHVPESLSCPSSLEHLGLEPRPLVASCPRLGKSQHQFLPCAKARPLSQESMDLFDFAGGCQCSNDHNSSMLHHFLTFSAFERHQHEQHQQTAGYLEETDLKSAAPKPGSSTTESQMSTGHGTVQPWAQPRQSPQSHLPPIASKHGPQHSLPVARLPGTSTLLSDHKNEPEDGTKIPAIHPIGLDSSIQEYRDLWNRRESFALGLGQCSSLRLGGFDSNFGEEMGTLVEGIAPVHSRMKRQIEQFGGFMNTPDDQTHEEHSSSREDEAGVKKLQNFP